MLLHRRIVMPKSGVGVNSNLGEVAFHGMEATV